MSEKTGKKKLSLAAKTFIGFALGIVIGLIFKEKASIIKPIGTIFLNMIKMIVVPMVFSPSRLVSQIWATCVSCAASA